MKINQKYWKYIPGVTRINTGQLLMIIFVLFILPCIGHAQELPLYPNLTDTNNLRQGPWVIYFDNRWNEISVAEEAAYYRTIEYRNNVPVGKTQDRYRGGQLQWEGVLRSDRPDVYEGSQTWYYQSGEVKSTALFVNGELSGAFKFYLRDGSPAIENWTEMFYDRALDAVEMDDFVAAENLFKSALPHIEAIFEKESEEYADVLYWLSIVSHNLGDREKVLDYDLRLFSIFKVIRNSGDGDLLSRTFDIARGYRFLRQWERSREWYEQFLHDEKEYYSGFHPSHGLALSGLGDVLIELQEFAQGLETLKMAEAFYETHPPEDELERELLSHLMNNANFLAGEWKGGRDFLLKQLSTFEKNHGKQSRSYAVALSGLGNFYKMNGQLREAESSFLSSLQILKSLPDVESFELLSSSIPLIEVYCQLGYAPAALEHVELTERIFQKMDTSNVVYKQMYVGFLVRLVQYYSFLGDHTLSGKTLQTLINFSQTKLQDVPVERLKAVSLLIDHQLIKKHWLHAHETAIGLISVADALSSTAMNATEIRAVARLYQQVASLHYLNTGSTANASYDLADKFFLKSLQIYDKLINQEFIPERIDVWLGQAMLREVQGLTQEADHLYSKCLNEVERTFGKNHIYYAQILFAIAKKSEIRRDYHVSRTYYVQALSKLEKYFQEIFPFLTLSEKEKFYSSNKEWIDNFQSFAVNHYQNDNALAGDLYNTLLWNKGIVLQSVSRIRDLILESNDETTIELYQQWLDLKNKLMRQYQRGSAIPEEINTVSNELAVIERKLSSVSADFKDWQQATISWMDIRKKLGKGEAAIEIAYVKREIKGDSVYVALIVKEESLHPEVVLISDAGFLEKRQIRLYRNSIRLKIPDTLSYGAFWKPLEPHLQGITRAYISADGVYHQINIATLLNPELNRYVVDQMMVTNVSSTAQLTFRSVHEFKNRKAILVAHPDYGVSQESKTLSDQRSLDVNSITDLPGTETERKTLSGIFRDYQLPYLDLSGVAATEEAIKSVNNPFVLHIATHGYFLPDLGGGTGGENFLGVSKQSVQQNPLLLSGLLLAGCKSQPWKRNDFYSSRSEDGILSAFEASTLKLAKTEMVVLSACETALGEIKNGEGVYGLQRAFMMAGARRILMSLWKVDDDATQQFMAAFYTEWLRSHDAGSAFQYAQKEIKKLYNDPYYWGAFVLSGGN